MDFSLGLPLIVRLSIRYFVSLVLPFPYPGQLSSLSSQFLLFKKDLIFYISIMLQTSLQAQIGVAYAKLQVTKLRLKHHNIGSVNSGILNQSIRNHLISAG